MTETPWYLSRSFVLIAVIFFGPFGLPLLWWSPRYSLVSKIFMTVLAVTFATLGILMFPRLKHDIQMTLQAFPELDPYIPGFLK